MTFFIVLAVLLVTSIAGLSVLLRTDGYGHLPTPRSHAEELPLGLAYRA